MTAVALLECGDCRQTFTDHAGADEHEMTTPGHLTFYMGCIPPGYIPTDDPFDLGVPL